MNPCPARLLPAQATTSTAHRASAIGLTSHQQAADPAASQTAEGNASPSGAQHTHEPRPEAACAAKVTSPEGRRSAAACV